MCPSLIDLDEHRFALALLPVVRVTSRVGVATLRLTDRARAAAFAATRDAILTAAILSAAILVSAGVRAAAERCASAIGVLHVGRCYNRLKAGGGIVAG